MPQSSNPCGEIFFGQRAFQTIGRAVGRVEFQKSDKNSIFARYMITGYTEDPPIKYDPNVLNAGTAGSTILRSLHDWKHVPLEFKRGSVVSPGGEPDRGPPLSALRSSAILIIGINMYSIVPHYMGSQSRVVSVSEAEAGTTRL